MQKAGDSPLHSNRASFDRTDQSDDSSHSSDIVSSDLLPPLRLENTTTATVHAPQARIRRDSHSVNDVRALLRHQTASDVILQRDSLLSNVLQQSDHASLLSRLSISPQADELAMSSPANLAIAAQNPSAFSRFYTLGQKRPPSPCDEFKLSIQTLAAIRNSIKLSQKSELEQASHEYNRKAKEAGQFVLHTIRQAPEDTSRVENAISLLNEILLGDVYEENDSYLFELLTQDPATEQLVCQRLVNSLCQTIRGSARETLLRLDQGAAQKLLRVMHNGYLKVLFDKLDPYIEKIRNSRYLEHKDSGDTMRVKAAMKDALKCISITRKILRYLPENLLRVYRQVYQAICDEFHDERYADIQLCQFIFLRAINPRITKVHQIDLYTVVDEQRLVSESYKNEQCMVISKTIQTALGFLLQQKAEKQERLMTLKDPKSAKTLLDLASAEPTLIKLSEFIKELKIALSRR